MGALFKRKNKQAEAEATQEDAQELPRPAPARVPKKKPAKKASVATHPIFVPLIAIWGAALGALSILALPNSLILKIATGFGIANLGVPANLLFAGIAALLVGTLAILGAIAFQRSEKRFAGRDEADDDGDWDEPIDPAAELGSDSLDSPIEIEPFSTSEIDDDDDDFADLSQYSLGSETAHQDYADAWHEDADVSEPAQAEETDQIDDFDLDRYEEWPERPENWSYEVRRADSSAIPQGYQPEAAAQPAPDFEFKAPPTPKLILEPDAAPQPAPEPEPEPEPETRTVPLASTIAPATSAAEKLRQVPPEQLSLVEMVERFAVALHEHQEAERRIPGSQHTPHRDAALAEALKTLALFTEEGFNVGPNGNADHASALRDTTNELREALTKLQNLRGAA